MNAADDEGVRAQAATSLRLVEGPEADALLAKAVTDDKSPDVRAQAVAATHAFVLLNVTTVLPEL